MKNWEEISEMLDKLHVEMTETKTDVKWIKKALDGNGKKGLIQQVQENTYWRYGMSSAITIIIGLISYGVIKIF